MLVKHFSVENSERVKEISMLDLKKKKLYYNILNVFFLYSITLHLPLFIAFVIPRNFHNCTFR